MSEVSTGSVGRFERLLSGARFQRTATSVLSLLALASVLLVFMRWEFRPFAGEAGDAASLVLRKGGTVAILSMVVVAAGLGLFLAWRGHRRELTRLLGLSASSLACGAGQFLAMRSFAISQGLRNRDVEVYLAGMTTLLLISVALMAIWIFSTTRFLIMFPKPVKLAGLDYEAEDWNQLRWRWEWKWRWLWSPQAVALAAGAGLIYLVCTDQLLPSDRWSFVSAYVVTWAPFAILSAKQGQLDEEGRRAIRWVLAGQSVWLAMFLLSMLGILVARDAGLLRHASWNDLRAFTDAFFAVAYCGFVTVLLATLAFSIFYDGTLDPDLMLGRTWLLATLGMISGVMFVVIERLLAGLLADWFGLSTVDALTLVAILTAAAVYPMRRVAEAALHGLTRRWQSDTAIARGERRDVSIVFADLSGYTRLTEQDEQAALVMAGVFHRDAYQAARQYNGRVVKTIGDAVMLEFPDGDAAYAALETLREAFGNHIKALSMDALPIHAGIHHGEVVQGPDGDIFGAAVNLAARLLGAAGPNEIVASGAAIRGRALEGRGVYLGERTFKNVANPVGCYRLA